MMQVILQFPSLDLLWSFRIEASIDFVDMDKERILLICRCLREHLQLALLKYHATVKVKENPVEQFGEDVAS